MPVRPFVALTTGVLALGGAALTFAGAADATPQPSPTSTNAPATPAAPKPRVSAAPSASAEPTTSNRAPSSVPATPSPSSARGAGGIDVPAGQVTITRHDSEPALPLALGGAGVLLAAGGATAALRRRR